MKSLETKLSEALSIARKNNINIEPFLTGGSIEQRLNKVTEALKSKGVTLTEKHVLRNNGRSVEIMESLRGSNSADVRSDDRKFEREARTFVNRYGVTFEEAVRHLGRADFKPATETQASDAAKQLARTYGITVQEADRFLGREL